MSYYQDPEPKSEHLTQKLLVYLFAIIMPEQMCGVTDRCPVRAFTPKAQRTLDKMCRVMDTNPIINIVTSAVYLRHPELFYPVGLRGSLREERYTGAISVKYCTPSLTFMFQKHQDFFEAINTHYMGILHFFPTCLMVPYNLVCDLPLCTKICVHWIRV